MEQVILPFIRYVDELAYLERLHDNKAVSVINSFNNEWQEIQAKLIEQKARWISLYKKATEDCNPISHHNYEVDKGAMLEIRYGTHSFNEIQFGKKIWPSVYSWEYVKEEKMLLIVEDKTYVGSEDLVLSAWKYEKEKGKFKFIWKIENIGDEMILDKDILYIQKCNSIQRYYSIIGINIINGEFKQVCYSRRWDQVVIPLCVNNNNLWYFQCGRRFKNLWICSLNNNSSKIVINQNTEPNLLGFQYPYWWTDNAVYHLRNKQKIVDFTAEQKNEKIFKIFVLSRRNFYLQTITNQIVKMYFFVDGSLEEIFSPGTGGRLSHLGEGNFIWFPPNEGASRIQMKNKELLIKRINEYDFKKEIKYDYVILKRNDSHIPVSTIKPAGKIKGLLAYVYGYYGTPTPIHLSPRWIAWLRAGFSVSFIGVRGGGDNGFEGWDSARGNERKEGILDYISAVGQLQLRFSIKPENTILFGRSAAGMTVASVLTLIDNPRKLCGAVWGEAPYVDVIKGCLNHKVPVAPLERDEFFPVLNYYGFRIAEELDPTLRLPKGPSVPVLATGGLHDSEVMPWEPMKWCLRLREKNWQHVACRIDKQTGHFMAGEYAYDKFAEDSAFLLSAIGLDLHEQ